MARRLNSFEQTQNGEFIYVIDKISFRCSYLQQLLARRDRLVSAHHRHRGQGVRLGLLRGENGRIPVGCHPKNTIIGVFKYLKNKNDQYT